MNNRERSVNVKKQVRAATRNETARQLVEDGRFPNTKSARAYVRALLKAKGAHNGR